MTRTSRVGYRSQVQWIADHDSPGDDDSMSVEAVSGLVTVCLVADTWGKTQVKVARDVVRRRRMALESR